MIRTIGQGTVFALLAAIQGGVAAGGQSTDYKMQLQQKEFEAISNKQKPITEQTYLEVADWFGKTGLPEQIERSLPRYLRKQIGQFVGDRDALKASDLKYLGTRSDGLDKVHYWELPAQHLPQKYAYIVVDSDGQAHIGVGDRPIPQQ